MPLYCQYIVLAFRAFVPCRPTATNQFLTPNRSLAHDSMICKSNRLLSKSGPIRFVHRLISTAAAINQQTEQGLGKLRSLRQRSAYLGTNLPSTMHCGLLNNTSSSYRPADGTSSAPSEPVTRVVSFLPSATEILCCIGGQHLLVGRSHECDYPPSITDRPALTGAINAFESSRQMHDAVTSTLERGEGLYTIDGEILKGLNPQVILTQSLCSVCSVDLNLVDRILQGANHRLATVSLNAFSLQEVIQDCEIVGKAVGKSLIID